MGRFPNIAAAKAKTGAAKGKLYGMYAKEIYLAAKNGGVSPEGNSSLKRLIEKAKKDQVPADIIKRAIDKVSSGIDDSYQTTNYELFGPGGSTLIAVCLTDNVNRTVSDIRTVINKCHIKMGAMGSVSFMYDNYAIVGTKALNEEEMIEALIEKDVDIEDIEVDDETTIVYGKPQDLFRIKDAVASKIPNIDFDIDEIAYVPKERITLSDDDKQQFDKLISFLDEIEDVQNVYHNVAQ